MAAPAQAPAAARAAILDYLDTLRGDAATRPIWAFSRALVVDEPRSMARTFVALAATCRRARDLCTPGLRAYLVHPMAHALARGGAFLKGKRAGTLVTRRILHRKDWALCHYSFARRR